MENVLPSTIPASRIRPLLTGMRGAVSAAHPLAAAAGTEILASGGSAADAAIAAQAALCVLAPEACGLGGDMLALVRSSDGEVLAVNGTGAAPLEPGPLSADGGASVTVPGLVGGWEALSWKWGLLPLADCLAPALRLARRGFLMTDVLKRAVEAQRARLEAGGASRWEVLSAAPGDRLVQGALANVLDLIGKEHRFGFYHGSVAEAVAKAAGDHNGRLSTKDLAAHETPVLPSLPLSLHGATVHVQPPMSQGVLLLMALRAVEGLGPLAHPAAEHAEIEATLSAFAYRDRAAEGAKLIDLELQVNMARASNRIGPRPYLHTAGVATADARGMVVSSLISVFDEFGSGVYVPEGGFVLNNRAGGFTDGFNASGPGRRPVHTLAPALLDRPSGPLALATPGADGQVQVLLQIVRGILADQTGLAELLDRPRWRSESGRLLIERDHPQAAALQRMGHELEPLQEGDMRFGGVVAAGLELDVPIAGSDWRRETWAAVT